MQQRIDTWVASGGNRAALWESVKGATKREGVVLSPPSAAERPDPSAPPNAPPPPDEQKRQHERQHIIVATQPRVEREIARLHTLIAGWDTKRAQVRREMEVVAWRARLLELATARAEGRDECGWDLRICWAEEEYEEFGATALSSYAAPTEEKASAEGMIVDEEETWWCPVKRKCRHSG
jgi:COMPASS component SPP1